MYTPISQLPTHEKLSIIDELIDNLQKCFTQGAEVPPIVQKQLNIAQRFRMRIIKRAKI